ncbi:MAG: hypothetical protein ACKPKO_36795 [Candidatus Fonsibacter sp.]
MNQNNQNSKMNNQTVSQDNLNNQIQIQKHIYQIVKYMILIYMTTLRNSRISLQGTIT